MNKNEFLKGSQSLLKEAYELLLVKNEAYTSSNDPFQSFNECANLLDLSPQETVLVHFHKQLTALLNVTLRGSKDTDGFNSRCIDMINYIVILNAMGEVNRCIVDESIKEMGQ